MPGTAGTLDSTQDRNQEYTIMGISGTLGPTYGTAEPRPLTVTEDGKLNTQTTLSLTAGTLSSLGTVGTLQAGTITRVQTVGTLEVATVSSLPNIPGGTLGELTSLANLAKGTITRLEGGTLGILSQGSVNVTAGTFIMTNGTVGAGTVAISAGTVGGKAASGAAAVANPVLVAGTDAGGTVYSLLVDTKGQQLIGGGTITNSGTTTGVGTVSGVAVVTSLSAGTITRLEGGTLGILSQGSVNVTAGTIGGKAASGAAAVANPVLVAGTDAGGTVYAPLMTTTGHQVVDISGGSVAVTAGTMIMTAGTVAAGTIAVSAGTITHGTIDAGTVAVSAGTINVGTVKIDPSGVVAPLIMGTLGTAGGSFFGTLSAVSGAGTKHYVQGVSIVVQSGTPDVRVLAGSSIQGTGVLAAGQFPPGGGMVKHWDPAFATGTNSELIYHFVGAGTAFITIDYWKAA